MCVDILCGLKFDLELLKKLADVRNVDPPSHMHKLMFSDLLPIDLYSRSEAER